MSNTKLRHAHQTANDKIVVEPVFYIMGKFGDTVEYIFFNNMGFIEKTSYIDRAESYGSYLEAQAAIEDRYLEFKTLEVDTIMIVKVTELSTVASFTSKDIADEVPTMKRLLEEKRSLELQLKRFNDKISKSSLELQLNRFNDKISKRGC